MSAHDASARKARAVSDAQIHDPAADGAATTAADAASFDTGSPDESKRDVIGLQAYLREQIEPAEVADDRPAAPAAGGGKSRFLPRLTKSLIGLALVAVAGWMPAQRLLQVSSIEAVMNAPLVTVRAPIDGIVETAGAPLVVGEPFPAGIALAGIDNPRADRRRLDDATAELGAAREDRDALSARLVDLKSLRTDLVGQLAAFRDNRLRQLDARIDEADARIAAAEAVAKNAASNRARLVALNDKGVAAQTTLADVQRDVEVANAETDEARAARAALAVERDALQSGVFFGDSYNDQPRSAQRLDEIDRQIAAAEADLARQQSRVRRAGAALTREQDAFALVRSANLAAPASGRVWEVLTAPGEQVAAGQALFSLIDCTHPMVTAVVSEVVFNSLSIGMPARFVYREGGEPLTGRVAQLSGVAVASSNLAIVASALQKESYRVAVALDAAPKGIACPVGRTGRVVFGAQGQ